MKYIAVIAILLSATAALSQTHVGRLVPPYPLGLQPQGACVAFQVSNETSCDFAISLLGKDETTISFIIGKKFAHRSPSGSYVFTVTDELPYPNIPKGYAFVYLGCRLDGKFDSTLMAVYKVDPHKVWSTDVIWAKKLDIKSGKFVNVALKSMSCANEGGDA